MNGDKALDDSQRFDAYLKAPSVWFHDGIGLLRAAFLLWDRFFDEFENRKKSAGGELDSDQLVALTTDRFIRSYMLLAGLAIENCVKAVIVAKGQLKFTKGALPKELNSHDLCRLFSRVGIDLSEADVLLVSRSAEAIKWKGRYAVPRRASDISDEGFPSYFNHPRDIVGLFRKMA